MARIDVRCPNDHVHEVDRPVKDWPATPPCPECGAETVQTHLPPRARWTPDPVVVFRAADGTFRFPGDPTGAYAERCARDGMERIELRGFADVRRFERVMNQHELSIARRKVEAQHQQQEARLKHTRSELHHRMRSMTPLGRAVARAAIARTDARPQPRAHEPGFRIEVYSENRSNRQESRDAQGRRRRD